MITNEEKMRLHVQLLCATLSGPAIDLDDGEGPRAPTDCLDVLIQSCGNAVDDLAMYWEGWGWMYVARKDLIPGVEDGWTLERFEALLVQSGIIPTAAIEDAEGYDGGTLKRVVAYAFGSLQRPYRGGAKTA